MEQIKKINNIIIFIIFGILIFLIHNTALRGYWRADDGFHLLYAVKYTPFQYFFNPNILRLQSGVNITPWNAFIYDINISLFGFNPKYYYLHILIILWLTTVIFYYLLKLYSNKKISFLGSILYSLGLPNIHIAQLLMNGHYAYGLLFCIISLIFYIQFLRKNKLFYLILSIIFYGLATLCKEVYIPFIGFYIFLNEKNIKLRLKSFIPFLIILIFYFLWRYEVLGCFLGGYNYLEINTNFLSYIKIIIKLPLYIFNFYELQKNLIFKYLFFVIFIVFTFIIIKKLNKNQLFLFFSIIIIILTPFLPLIKNNLINLPNRYFYLMWFFYSILIIFFFNNNLKAIIIIILSLSILNFYYQINFKNILMLNDCYYRSMDIKKNIYIFPFKIRNPYEKYIKAKELYFNKKLICPIILKSESDFYKNFNKPIFMCLPPFYKLKKINKNKKNEIKNIIIKEKLNFTNLLIKKFNLSNKKNFYGKIITYINTNKKILKFKIYNYNQNFLKGKFYMYFPYNDTYKFYLVNNLLKQMIFLNKEYFETIPFSFFYIDSNSALFSKKIKLNLRNNNINIKLQLNAEISNLYGISKFIKLNNFSGYTFKKGICKVEIPKNNYIIIKKAITFIKFSGWAIIANNKSLPKDIYFVLKNNNGRLYKAPLIRVIRDDVNKYFYKKNYLYSGWEILGLDFKNVKKGKYKLFIIQKDNSTIWICPTQKEIILNK